MPRAPEWRGQRRRLEGLDYRMRKQVQIAGAQANARLFIPPKGRRLKAFGMLIRSTVPTSCEKEAGASGARGTHNVSRTSGNLFEKECPLHVFSFARSLVEILKLARENCASDDRVPLRRLRVGLAHLYCMLWEGNFHIVKE